MLTSLFQKINWFKIQKQYICNKLNFTKIKKKVTSIFILVHTFQELLLHTKVVFSKTSDPLQRTHKKAVLEPYKIRLYPCNTLLQFTASNKRYPAQ